MVTKRDELKTLCGNLAAKYGHKSSSLAVGLELLSLELAIHEDPFADEFIDQEVAPNLSEYHPGFKADGGIDGLVYNAELSSVAITQAKYKKGSVDAETLEECRSFFNRLDQWTDRKRWGPLNEKAKTLLEQSALDPSQQDIRLYFVTSQSATPENDLEGQEIADDAASKYADKGWRVSCQFLSQSSLLKAFRDLSEKHRSALVTKTDFKISSEFSFVFDERNDHRVLICAVKGNEIRDLYLRTGVGEALFNANIRSALTTGLINPAIRATAQSKTEAGNFFFYNNGITATCTNFELDEGVVTTVNLQVVNGAQTVKALLEALRQPNPEVYVLLRLIETNQQYGHKSELADRITRFQNTQNPVKASDFYSNDPIQLWLSNNLPQRAGKGAIPAFWYENKRGVKPSSAKGPKVTMEQLAQLRYACLFEAPFIYKKAKDIWDSQNDNEEYWKAFGTNGAKVTEWSTEEVAEALWMINCFMKVRRIQKEMQAGKIEKVENEVAYLGVLAKYITALTYYGMIQLKAAGKFISFDDLIGSMQATSACEDPVLMEARRLVRAEFRNWSVKGVANPRLNMPQNAETWGRLRSFLLEEMKATGLLN